MLNTEIERFKMEDADMVQLGKKVTNGYKFKTSISKLYSAYNKENANK